MKSQEDIENKRTSLLSQIEVLKHEHLIAMEPDAAAEQKAAISQFYNRRIKSISDKIEMLDWVLDPTKFISELHSAENTLNQ